MLFDRSLHTPLELRLNQCWRIAQVPTTGLSKAPKSTIQALLPTTSVSPRLDLVLSHRHVTLFHLTLTATAHVEC